MEPTPESIELMPTTSVRFSLNTRKIRIASWNVNNATGRRLFILRKLQKRSEVIRKVIKPDVIVLQEISSPLAVKQICKCLNKNKLKKESVLHNQDI